MSRPAPRNSPLRGASPLTPPPNMPTEVDRQATDLAPARSTARTEEETPRGAKYPRLNCYIDSADEAGRIRASFLAGRGVE